MNADQVIQGIGDAVAAAKPAQEYCFLGCQHWSMCMTKSEWSGWMQAISSVVAICASALLAWWFSRAELRRQHEKNRRVAEVAALNLVPVLIELSSGLRQIDDKIEASRGTVSLEQMERWSQNVRSMLQALNGNAIQSFLDLRDGPSTEAAWVQLTCNGFLRVSEALMRSGAFPLEVDAGFRLQVTQAADCVIRLEKKVRKFLESRGMEIGDEVVK